MNFTHAQQFAQQGLYTGLDEARLQEAIPSGVLPRLAYSIEALRQAHGDLLSLTEVLCGPNAPSNVGSKSANPNTPCVADAIDVAASDADVIASSISGCVHRIRNRLIG